MPPVVTVTGVLTCIHQGRASPVPGQVKLTVAGQPVLVGTDLLSAPIAGCVNLPTQALPSNVPCALTVGAPQGASTVLKVDGVGVLLVSAGGATTSSPPGRWTVTTPGQTVVNVQG